MNISPILVHYTPLNDHRHEIENINAKVLVIHNTVPVELSYLARFTEVDLHFRHKA